MPVYDHKRPRGVPPGRRRDQIRRMMGLGLLVAVLASLGAIWSTQATRTQPAAEAPDTPLEPTVDSAHPDSADSTAEAEPAILTIEGRIRPRQIFSDALMGKGVAREHVFELVRALRTGIHRAEFNPNIVQTGDRYTLVLDSLGAVQSFDYIRKGSLENRFVARREQTGELHAWKEREPLEKEVVVVVGKIDDSLWSALGESGENPDFLSTKMIEIFEYDVDFMVDCRSGDRFSFAVEKFFKEGDFVKYGDILAAEYGSAKRSYKAYLYEAPDGDAAYYGDDGKSLRGLFLKSPLNYRRISSGFTRKRYHPILKKYIPHHGIDYAADYGTRVWATADGTVTFTGRKGALGNYVEIRHKNGYKTGYGHLSRIRRGLKKGSRVTQKYVIGNVGATGRATGPHLHYNFIVNEGGRQKYVDAATVVNRPTGKPVPISRMDHFRTHRNFLWALLNQVSEGETTASLNVTSQYEAAFLGGFPGIAE